jgi:N6-adenosine-specific RNA methylase IME4
MTKKYQIIYADPPWTFRTYSPKGKEKKSAELHYDCMSIEDIYNFPVQQLADDDCLLFLWVTSPMLKEGLETIKRWGFEYKTIAFNWFKKNKKADSWFWGLGYWTRQNTELCLLATKGNPKRVSKSIHQVVEDDNYIVVMDTEAIATKIREHSRKPDEVRERIVDLCGDVPRIELFARQRFPGWDVHGLEVESSIEIPE